MSTRSIIAKPQGDGWKGRYCHSDGYPSWQLVQLRRLVTEHGTESVLQTIMEDHYGWSSINQDSEPLGPGREDGRFQSVPGYGVAYTTEQGQTSPDEWYSEKDTDSWCEWAYVIYPKHITVLRNAGSSWALVATVEHDKAFTVDDVNALEECCNA